MAKRSHPDLATLRALASGDLPSDGHVDGCLECRKEVDMLKSLFAYVGEGPAAGECPSAELLLRWIDAGLEPAPGEIDDHLTACLSCAAEVEALSRASRRTSVPPGTREAAPSLTSEVLAALRALITFEMPLVAVPVTRAAASAGTQSLREAVDALARGRRDEALARLGALREGPAELRAPVELLLGAALLESARAHEALPHLEAAVKARPRLPEPRWYLAQALLQVGRGPDALAHLERMSTLPGPRRDEAREVASRLRELLGAGPEE